MTIKATIHGPTSYGRYEATMASQGAMAARIEAPAGSADILEEADRIYQRAGELIRQDTWSEADSAETCALLDQARDVFRRAWDRAHAK